MFQIEWVTGSHFISTRVSALLYCGYYLNKFLRKRAQRMKIFFKTKWKTIHHIIPYPEEMFSSIILTHVRDFLLISTDVKWLKSYVGFELLWIFRFSKPLRRFHRIRQKYISPGILYAPRIFPHHYCYATDGRFPRHMFWINRHAWIKLNSF